MTQRNFPNFVIAGVNKAGTTSVFQYLNGHPQVCSSRDKETGYFLPYRYGEQALPIEKYAEQFLDYKNEKIIMEATPGYFFGGLPLANAMHDLVQLNCKVLIIFREPVSRLVSFYRAKKKSLELDRNMDFKSYVQACMKLSKQEILLRENNKLTGINAGCYVNFIDDWFIVFGKNLKIVFFDDLTANPKKFMIELCNWLEIDAGYFDNFNFEIENKTYAFKNRVVQKMAVNINMGAARFWRKNPNLKKWIRKQYFKVNKSDEKEMLDQETVNAVTALYQPYNSKLKLFLNNKGITDTPVWLNI
ncbi:MAG: sulfotransferase domain-containing protein [Bacteroidota bacterium]